MDEQLRERIEKLEERQSDYENENEKQHKEFFEKYAELAQNNSVQQVRYDHIIEKLSDLTTKVAELTMKVTSMELKPAKHWESVVEKIITLIVAAFVGYALSKIGLQ